MNPILIAGLRDLKIVGDDGLSEFLLRGAG